MRFFDIICPLALVAIAPVLAQEAEDIYDLYARNADPLSIKFNPAFGDVRKGLLGNPDEVKNKKKGDKGSKDTDGDDDSSDTSGDESENKKGKKSNKDKKLLERALYIRDLMDEFLEERGLDEDELYFD